MTLIGKEVEPESPLSLPDGKAGGYSHDIEFSASAFDTVSWAGGTVSFTNGQTLAIGAGGPVSLTPGSTYWAFATWGEAEVSLYSSPLVGDSERFLLAVISVNASASLGVKPYILTIGGKPLIATGAQLADKAVTYAKMQDVSASPKLLGRKTSGAGVVEEVSYSDIDHGAFGDLTANDHTQYVLHSLAQNVSDFLVGTLTPSAQWIQRTLAQTLTILGKGIASGLATLNESSKVVEQPASITDHLENPPSNGEATKAATSDWAYDHNANADAHHAQLHDLDSHVTGKLVLPDSSELTIAAGVVTVTGSHHYIDTEADAATDDLVYIDGGLEGQILIIGLMSASRIVTVKHRTGAGGAGEIWLNNAQDFVFEGNYECCLVLRKGDPAVTPGWVEIGRFKRTNTAGSGDVTGPASSTAGNVATFSDTTGKVIEDSGVDIAGIGDVNGPASAVTDGAMVRFDGTDGKTLKAGAIDADQDITLLEIDTWYHNTSGFPLMVTVTWLATGTATVRIFCYASESETEPVAIQTLVDTTGPISFAVPTGYYYEIESIGTVTLVKTTVWTIG